MTLEHATHSDGVGTYLARAGGIRKLLRCMTDWTVQLRAQVMDMIVMSVLC